MTRLAIALLVLVAAATAAPIAAGQSSTRTYAGTHVSFDTADGAVIDYAVDGEPMLDAVRVESRRDVEDGALVDAGASLSAVTRIDGAALDLEADAGTGARLAVGNGATVTAHDGGHGVLLVESGDRSDYVVADLPAGATASAESDSRVAVTTADGTNATVLVVGEGTLTVNDDGGVTARLGEDGRLAFRSYPAGTDAGDDRQERLIADGRAAAETYVASAGADPAIGAVTYDRNTTVEAADATDSAVTVTVTRTPDGGTVLLTGLPGRAPDATDDLTVTVDGEAAAEAAAYTQLESALGSEQSRYMVESGAEASAGADVVVAVNRFSARTVTVASDDAADGVATAGADAANGEPSTGTATDGTDADATAPGGDGGVPGFTATTAAVALAGAALVARRR
ncbi:PGF-CTERM sorting domain-containing protein [Halorussus marinus]|uniref:PGF-CTERM sorting domain-containing protein n=1 Tax=Halorussus marinus TaxID=2505976 RepID=UPI00106DF02A|nr:PGF-CTERM sorting domain-containing protein [Halorussus marinus]